MRTLKYGVWSVLICLLFAIIGGLFTGDALESWFVHLDQPWFGLPLEGWYVVAGLYYLIVITILFRIFQITSGSPRSTKAFWWTIAMLTGNEFWNLLLFGFQSTYLGFVSLFPFTVVVMGLFLSLRKLRKRLSWLLVPYMIWLIYDFAWTYALWKLNS